MSGQWPSIMSWPEKFAALLQNLVDRQDEDLVPCKNIAYAIINAKCTFFYTDQIFKAKFILRKLHKLRQIQNLN